jgi:hypothetical protein
MIGMARISMDLTNQRFGKLIVVKFDQKVEYGAMRHAKWLCKCDCGNIISIFQSSLRKGSSKSCGCAAKNRSPNLLNQRFGRLTVVKFDGIKYSGIRRFGSWICRCDCGNEKTILTGSLLSKSNPTKSCGCLNLETMEKHGFSILKDGSTGFKRIKRAYAFKAKKRKLSFDLDDDTLKILFKGNCYYCDGEPKSVSRCNVAAVRSETRIKTSYVYNGIDRVNNEIGYTKDNCVSCCEICNRMKTVQTLEEFFSVIQKIYKKHCGGV